jgi:signal transduction histidine kinase
VDTPLLLVGSFVLGGVLGGSAAALLARWQIRRSLTRVREAEQRARAAERFAEIGAMTSGLAHEIKNPLSTIGLNAQLLAEAIDDLPPDRPAPADELSRLKRRLSSLRREVERLRGILTDFLAYAGELRLDPTPSDLNQLVDDLADFYGPQAAQQGVRVRVDLADQALVASIDVGHTKQAVLNLILNAVQAMAPSASSVLGSPGSPVSPAAANAVPRELILRVREARDPVSPPRPPRPARRAQDSKVPPASRWGVITVIDTGPGIAPDVLPRIFQPYYTTKAGGSGLGLPTTRRLIEAQHGRVEVVSEPGKGTAFSIHLPLAGDGAWPAPVPTGSASPSAPVDRPAHERGRG